MPAALADTGTLALSTPSPTNLPRQRGAMPSPAHRPAWGVPGRTALLIDLDNLAICAGAALPPGRVAGLLQRVLAAAGDVEYRLAVAPAATVTRYGAQLAAAGVPWALVDPGPDAADLEMVARAHELAARGFSRFVVASADHAFAPLADAYPTRVVVRVGQPVSRALDRRASQVVAV